MTERTGMIHYYFGSGKGKTSAAAGACIRAMGQGMRCLAVQFHKDGSSGEMAAMRALGAEVRACHGGVKFFRKMNGQERQELKREHDLNLRAAIGSDAEIIMLDELGDAVKNGAADMELVEKVLEKRGCELIITGHGAVEPFMERADYLTEFGCLKHPYKNGIKARRGIEW
ncbi:MAG: cob(I)yrinic acid a,c-diamide adenosyltransferase [Ruminococcus sp.]|nr:cob(I)yrinic acid a,c-diamide adenosyltransferase [Ruminococcus sp.]